MPAHSEDEEAVDDVYSDDIIHPGQLGEDLEHLVKCASLNNMASIYKDKDDQAWQANGDPTEIALQVFAHKAGLGKPLLLVFSLL
jgi:Na+-exporting ATPase